MEHVEQSDEESDVTSISSSDITHSSASISEGEADANLEGLGKPIAELEELSQELSQRQEATIGALNATIKMSAINNVNLQLKEQVDVHVDKIKQHLEQILNKFTTATNVDARRYQQELNELTSKNRADIMNLKAKHNEYVKILKDENITLADRLNKQVRDLESRHAKELSGFQAQLAHCKKTIEALKLELINNTSSQKDAQSEVQFYKKKVNELKVEAENVRRMHSREKDFLDKHIMLQKTQLERMTSKHIKSLNSLQNSKDSIEHSLEQTLLNAAALKAENDTLKIKLNDISRRYFAAQSTIENSQLNDRSLSDMFNDISSIEKSLSGLDDTNMATVSEETVCKTFDEEAKQHQMRRKLEKRKLQIEKLTDEKAEKVRIVEVDLTKENNELKQLDVAKTCEKQANDKSDLLFENEEGGTYAAEFEERLNLILKMSDCSNRRIPFLLQDLKDGNASLNHLRTEFEARHAREMELRTYFERKYLQMEKQSKEIFSQQSIRISDNDSETVELTKNDSETKELADNDSEIVELSDNDGETEEPSNNHSKTKELADNDGETEEPSNNHSKTKELANNDGKTEKLTLEDQAHIIQLLRKELVNKEKKFQTSKNAGFNWSENELRTLYRLFSTCFETRTIPTREKVEDVLEANPGALARSVDSILTKCRRELQKNN